MFRHYLKNWHRVIYKLRPAKANVTTKTTLAALFTKQQELNDNKKDLKITKILKEAVNKKDFLDSLCYLIVIHNLLYSIIKWSEFQAFLHICNYTLISKDGLLAKS